MNFNVKKIPPEIGYYLTGFTDAEGCFYVSFSPKTCNTSWDISPGFNISQKERHIIAQFKKHLKCGTVYTNVKTGVSRYDVTNLHALRTHIIPFFKKYNFQSAKKKGDFSNFCKVLTILEKPELTRFDVEQILTFRINTKVIVAKRKHSDEKILSVFNDLNTTIKVKQSSETNTPNSEVSDKHLLIPLMEKEMIESNLCGDIKAQTELGFYIAGFADRDGSFNVSFRKRDDYRLGWKINPSFSIAQRDKIVLELFQKQLNCGKTRKGTSEGIWYLEVLDLVDLRTKIVPFFENYIFLSENTVKRFKNFKLTLDILSNTPLSRSNVEEILALQRNPNSKTRYSIQDILDRVDVFLAKQKNRA